MVPVYTEAPPLFYVYVLMTLSGLENDGFK